MSFVRTIRKLPREIWILFAITLINRAGTMVLPFLILYLTEQLHFTSGRAGLVMTLYGVGALITAPLSGRLTDRFGTLFLMRGSLLSTALILLLLPLARSFWPVVIGVVLFAILNEMFRPASLAAVSRFVDAEHRKTAYSVNRLAVNLGMSIGPALGGYLASSSFFWLFLVDGMTSLAAGTLLLFSRFREHQPDEATQEHKTAASVAGFRDRRFVFYLIASIPITFVFFQHISSMALFFVRDLHLSESVYGLTFTLNTLLVVFLEVYLNMATSHWSHRKTLMIGTFLSCAGFGLFALATGLWSVIPGVIVWTFGEMILFPGMTAYVAHIAPPQRQGEYMGLFMMAFAFAFMIAPWIGTQLLMVLGGPIFWLVIFLTGMISFFMFYRVK